MILRDARGWTGAENLLSPLQEMSQGTLEKQIMEACTAQFSFAAIAEKRLNVSALFNSLWMSAAWEGVMHSHIMIP